MDTAKSNNERELTSTMGNVLSMSSKDEKNDTSDATPTSSTDANTTSTTSQIVSDDPISSTSSDIIEQNKSKATEVSMQNSVRTSEPDKSSSADHEADLLEMSISNVPNEKITEDVEDLVHDLESLLGESTDSFNVPVKRKEDLKAPDVKVVDVPQTSKMADTEVLSSGDPICDVLSTKALDVKSLEDELERQERSYKNNTCQDEPIDVSIEPQSSSECQTFEGAEIEEESNVVVAENDKAVEDALEPVEILKEQLQDLDAEGGRTEETLKEETSENIEETIEKDSDEKIVQQKKGSSIEDEVKEELAPNSENIVIESMAEESVKEDNEPVQDIEEIIESKTIESTKDVVKDIEPVQLIEEGKLYGIFNVEGGPSGDHNLEEQIAQNEKTDESQPKDGLGDLKTEITDSNICSNAPPTTKQSLKDPDPHQEDKEIDLEDSGGENAEENEVVEDLTEKKGIGETGPSSTADKLEEEPSIEEKAEQEIFAPTEEVECEVEPNSVQTEAASNTEIKEDEQDPPEDVIIEDFEVKSQEEIKEVESSKEKEESLDQSDTILSESKDIPEKEESKPDLIPVPEAPVESDPAASDLQNEAVASSLETAEETEAVKSPVVVIEDEPEGIVSEPEQIKESTVEAPEDSEVEIVEVTEEMEEKLDEEVFEGVVTDELGQRVMAENVEIETEVAEIPVIVVEPPDDTKEDVEEKEDMTTVEETISEVTEDVAEDQKQEDGKCEEPIEISQPIPEIKETNIETAQEAMDEDKSDGTVDIAKSPTHKDESLKPIEIPDIGEEITKVHETPVPDETPTLLEDIAKPDEGTVESIEETTNLHDVETPQSLDETQNVVEEIPTPISTESVAPVDETQFAKVVDENDIPAEEAFKPVEEAIKEVEETTKPFDETIKSVDETINLVKETIEQVEETTKPFDKTIKLVEEASKPVEETINLVEETSKPDDETIKLVEETITPIEETVKLVDEALKAVKEPCPIVTGKIGDETPVEETETAEAVAASYETPTSCDDVPQPFDEAPSSSNETLLISNEVLSNEDVVISEAVEMDAETPKGIDEASESIDEASKNIDESSKGIDEAFKVVVAEETLEFVEDVSQDEVTEERKRIDTMAKTAPESSEEAEDELSETQPDNNRVIEISDDDSKPVDGGDDDYVQVLSSGGETDSEDMVPVLALEPDENNPSPKEPIGAKDDAEIERSRTIEVASAAEPLPELEDILADRSHVDEAASSIDMQENLETILAVANLQNADSTETVVEPQMSEKERREMEALRKAVESITDNSAVELEVEEVIRVEDTLVETVAEEELVEAVIPDLVEEKVEVIEEVEDKMEQVESDTDQDVPELRIEDSEDTQDVEENVIEAREEQPPHALPDTSDNAENERKKVLPDSSQVVLANDQTKQSDAPRESKSKSNERPRRRKKSISDNKLGELSINVDVPDKEKPYSPKITIKPIRAPDDEVSTTSNSDSELTKGSLKMTITKQSDKMHSILKICEPETSDTAPELEEPIPKLIIKPKMQQVEQQHSPKMSTRSSKQMYSPTSSTQRSGSPRITIKPVVKPDKVEPISPLKIKIKPEDGSKKHNPKLSIKPIVKPEEETCVQTARKVIIKPVVKPGDEPEQVHSPRITIKPILKPDMEKESAMTPRLNIKPIKKQDDEELEVEKERSSPKIIIKPIVKPVEPDTQTSNEEEEVKERIVLKINKGNLPTPTKDSKKREHPPDDDKSEKLAKITVKFSKGGGHPHIVHQSDESNKRVHEEPATPEKTKKQKTEAAESPMSTRSKHKDSVIDSPVETRSKHKETSDNPSDKSRHNDVESPSHDFSKSKHKEATESPIEPKRAKLKETPPETPIYESTRSRHREVSESSKYKEMSADNADVTIIETKLDSPIVISEDSRSQDSSSCVIVEDVKDPLASIPVFEVRAESKAMTPKQESVGSAPSTPSSTPSTPTPRKRGRPRKVPIVVREEFKEQEEPKVDFPPKEEEQKPAQESGRPKRSCRGQSARATLGIKPRKPRGPGRGRGGKRGMGTRPVPMKPEREPKLSKAKLKLLQESLKEEAANATEEVHDKPMLHCLLSSIEIKAPAPVLAPPETIPIEVPVSPSTSLPVPSPQAPVASPTPAASPKPVIQLSTGENDSTIGAGPSTRLSGEIVMVDEETRMSADTNSRAQTPAKQVPTDAVIEESQSSVQSTATTESGKARPNKAPRLEVQEPEGAVISADQLTEYYWNGNGPYMLQEQVAQFLGIKSFKRKYPGIMRRMLDMQERDFIRESGLATEHMCDLGLTAVNSADILDIMYSDFQDKYEEYCKHQRDRQAKDLINKQRALSLAASQEKNKADITEQAVQSAAQWNATFNKTRREQRKACMDLQTLTVHYPKGKMKQIGDSKVGDYPVALVPGQFTDYYKEFTPTEINNLPINTMCYDPINIIPADESEDSGSDGSDSDSDSSSSSSGSGSDSSSGVEDCKLCKTSPKKVSPNK